MARQEYSAGCVSKPTWFLEFKKFVKLLDSGKSYQDIRSLSIEENVFSATTEYRAKQIYNGVSKRVMILPKEFLELFSQVDLAAQKMIVLIAILELDKLFFEFVYEVYREKLILGIQEIMDSDINIFFKNKQSQSETVASWKDYTIKKLGQCYTAYLYDVGMINLIEGKRIILKPLLDIDLENCLRKYEKEHILRALTGVD